MGDFDTAAEAYDAWEEAWYRDRQEQADKMRTRGYAMACLKRAEEACNAADKAAAALVRARTRAENAQKEMEAWLKQAELAARVVATDDPEWTAEVAQCLEECFG